MTFKTGSEPELLVGKGLGFFDTKFEALDAVPKGSEAPKEVKVNN